MSCLLSSVVKVSEKMMVTSQLDMALTMIQPVHVEVDCHCIPEGPQTTAWRRVWVERRLVRDWAGPGTALRGRERREGASSGGGRERRRRRGRQPGPAGEPGRPAPGGRAAPSPPGWSGPSQARRTLQHQYLLLSRSWQSRTKTKSQSQVIRSIHYHRHHFSVSYESLSWHRSDLYHYADRTLSVVTGDIGLDLPLFLVSTRPNRWTAVEPIIPTTADCQTFFAGFL